MEPGKKRQYPRVAVDLRARVSVLVPEQTFQPTVHDARVLDMSERGALVVMALTGDVYRSLLQQIRYCRLQFTEADELPHRMIGKAVWIQPESRGGAMQYKLGLFFEDIPDDELVRLRAFIDKLIAERGVLPET